MQPKKYGGVKLTEHDFDCTCKKCFKEYFVFTGNTNDLKTAKIIDLAEQEGGLKQYITQCLEQFPNYNQVCICTDSKYLVEDLGERKYRDVCCTCGGIKAVQV